jgi:DNA-binding Lrp family transcriptional regulator
MDEILRILERDARTTPDEIAHITGKSTSEVKKTIKKYENSGTIVKYRAIINKELIKESPKEVKALIEVKITPQKNVGFDYMAERIYKFPEVESCYLVSGTYDLLLIVAGKDLHTVANFVAEKLAPMENVRGTSTHFLLKVYKENGDILKHVEKNKRIPIVL